MPEKNEKVKQENKIAHWWRETVGELRKVVWPTRQQAVRLTLIVLATMLAMSFILFFFDTIFSRLIALILA